MAKTLRLGPKEEEEEEEEEEKKNKLNSPKLNTTIENMYTSKHSRLLMPVT